MPYAGCAAGAAPASSSRPPAFVTNDTAFPLGILDQSPIVAGATPADAVRATPTVEEAQGYPWTALERHEAAQTRRVIAGSPATVRAKREARLAAHEADEALIVTIAPDYASRQRSYELLAEAFRIHRRAA